MESPAWWRTASRKSLRDGIRHYVALVYGRQVQKPEDEQPATDPFDVASMPREERIKLAHELAEQHPELAKRIGMVS